MVEEAKLECEPDVDLAGGSSVADLSRVPFSVPLSCTMKGLSTNRTEAGRESWVGSGAGFSVSGESASLKSEKSNNGASSVNFFGNAGRKSKDGIRGASTDTRFSLLSVLSLSNKLNRKLPLLLVFGAISLELRFDGISLELRFDFRELNETRWFWNDCTACAGGAASSSATSSFTTTPSSISSSPASDMVESSEISAEGSTSWAVASAIVSICGRTS